VTVRAVDFDRTVGADFTWIYHLDFSPGFLTWISHVKEPWEHDFQVEWMAIERDANRSARTGTVRLYASIFPEVAKSKGAASSCTAAQRRTGMGVVYGDLGHPFPCSLS